MDERTKYYLTVIAHSRGYPQTITKLHIFAISEIINIKYVKNYY